MLDVHQAEAKLLDRMVPVGTMVLPLDEAVGGTLAQNIVAERDHPAFDRVTMDGIAIRFDDWQGGTRSFNVNGRQGAGQPPVPLREENRCVEVMTGASLPTDADTVVPIERIDINEATATIAEDYTPSRWQFVHRQGSDHPQGSTLLQPGMIIAAPETAVLAGSGYAEVEVARIPSVAVISTGDELVGVGGQVEPFQIRSSNDRAIQAVLRRAGYREVTRARFKDDRELLAREVKSLHDGHDVLILSGGVSMGKYDYVPLVMRDLGIEVVFHKVRQKPGLPMWFGVSETGKPVFALPGNPVSTLVCLVRYVIPALAHAQGQLVLGAEKVKLAREVEFTPDLTYFLPVRLTWDSSGQCFAEPQPTNTSGDFTSLACTDGFVELPRGPDLYPQGFAARLFRWW